MFFQTALLILFQPLLQSGFSIEQKVLMNDDRPLSDPPPKRVLGESVVFYNSRFSPNGRFLVGTGLDARLHWLEMSSNISSSAPLGGDKLFPTSSFCFTNKSIIVYFSDMKKVIFLDPSNGRIAHQMDIAWGSQSDDEPDCIPVSLDLSADDHMLAVLGVDRSGVSHVTLIDTSKGDMLRSIAIPAGLSLPHPQQFQKVAFFPGSTHVLAAGVGTKIYSWDVATGRIAWSIDCGEEVITFSLSQDGRFLASSLTPVHNLGSSVVIDPLLEKGCIQIWDTRTRRALECISTKGLAYHIAFSSDDSFILTSGQDGLVHIWEPYSGKQVRSFAVNGRAVSSAVMSPDGKRIAAVLDDGSVTYFPLTFGTPNDSSLEINDGSFDHLWSDLASDDAEQAFRAMSILSDASQDIASRMRKRLHPTRRLAQMITDLDSDDFDQRETAMKELKTVGPEVEPALRNALTLSSSAEARSRMERLLNDPDNWTLAGPESLRALRAIRVLERIGTPEARAVLEDLAKGAPEARQTQEARAALDFLDKRGAARP